MQRKCVREASGLVSLSVNMNIFVIMSTLLKAHPHCAMCMMTYLTGKSKINIWNTQGITVKSERI